MSASSGRKKVGNYQVEHELGQGGMGVVVRAEQAGLERPVVLKTLRRDLADNEVLEERFRREAQAAASIHHQNVVAVYDCFSWRGDTYIAQEYVEGTDLASVLQTLQRLEPRLAALIALEVTRGLEEIHERGIVHRDVKPSNILLGSGGEVKIADFGIALDARDSALTQAGHAVGTPLYMSAEQLLGERADTRSDLYSLGVVLYQMLAGRTPFLNDDSEESPSLVRRIESGRYPALRKLVPGTPRYLVRVIRSCLRGVPKKRMSSAQALRRALERALGSPCPVECRREIAAGLWERNIFQAPENQTVRVPRTARRPPRRRAALRWLAALALCAGGTAAAVASGWIDWRQIEIPPGWSALPGGRDAGEP
jgi:serine/threonine-protein kinase